MPTHVPQAGLESEPSAQCILFFFFKHFVWKTFKFVESQEISTGNLQVCPAAMLRISVSPFFFCPVII